MPLLSNIAMPLDCTDASLRAACAARLRVKPADVLSVRVIKRSVDARDKRDVHFVFSLDARLRSEAPPSPVPNDPLPIVRCPYRPVVVGLGPAGLFAAWHMARLGMRPIVLERGKNVDDRARDTRAFRETGLLLPESNVQFGEGGAGAFSDGKLVTGISDPRIRLVLQTLYECGAPEEILYESKPHIGTDRLPGVVKTLRERITALGGEVFFEHRLADIRLDAQRRVSGVAAARPDGSVVEIDTRDVLLAVGHSARDTFSMLRKLGLPMQAKPFSIGARIEHKQSLVDHAQYGSFAGHPRLGAADYKLNARLKDGRGAYTFCMCPGGTVVAAASELNGVVTNGMSAYLRDGENANSALLVGVEPSDFGSDDPLAGVAFQRKWENLAYAAGGGGYVAPAQLAGDLLADRPSSRAGGVRPTYRPGVRFTTLSQCLPRFVYDGLREAVLLFDRRLHGFAAPDAVLTGVETRSSSPVRLLRGETCMSAVEGLYPAGEGAGYAGGITSAAVDGLRCAEYLAARYAR